MDILRNCGLWQKKTQHKKTMCWRKDGDDSVAQERCDSLGTSSGCRQRLGVPGCRNYSGWCSPAGSSLVDNGNGTKTLRSPSAHWGLVLEESSAGTMETLHLLLISQKAKCIRPARNVTFRNKNGTSHTGQISENRPGKTHQDECNWRAWKITMRLRLIMNLGFARLV